ncbi:SPFH domain-containing protein [Streptomyces sp. MP131-18]|uniref:protein kinase domain-containing protein n=1 Tax=Streptomyces sp. MP131-18 TaxID=1857892 RepID=UPI00097C8CE1|nr:SPFH domain-containing protein [Streptomyces sp. MP131-18]ONK12965.1 Serine/threonine-protein kinase AfsK [Streptomyces sp. MP131-18]
MDIWISLLNGAVLIGLIALLRKSLQRIPVGNVGLVERLGRYHRTLTPGMSFVMFGVEKVAHHVDTRLQVVPLQPVRVTTRDNHALNADITVYLQVQDPVKAVYHVTNYVGAMEQQAYNTLRVTAGQLDAERALASRKEIGAALHQELARSADAWGLRIDRVLIDAIDPSSSSQATVTSHATPGSGGPAAGGAGVPHRPLRAEDPPRVGPYQLLARLGEGGMGTVYLGRSPAEQPVAVKVIRGPFAQDAAFRRRFTREIETARRVGGSRTAPLVDADPAGEPPWLATEYIPGPSLHYVISHHGALPSPTLYTIAGGMAEALAGIHACGIVHRDLKPSNIIISEDGPRVIDFGIARAVDATALTRTGHVVGTPGFLAPEQLTGAAVTPATDVYAYGMVLCHAGGLVPLADGQPIESVLRLLPEGLQELVRGCLAPDPAARPGLDDILARLSPPAPHETNEWLPPPVRTMVDLHAGTTRETVRLHA